jgi:predicted nucleic acid-binding protein
VIAYVDSSLVLRWLLKDEAGHVEARRLLTSPGAVFTTGTWTRIEVAGALTRASRAGRIPDDPTIHTQMLSILSPQGRVFPVSAPQAAIEESAMALARRYGLRAMDTWHLAIARMVLPELARPGQTTAFASRDRHQAEVAVALGLEPI